MSLRFDEEQVLLREMVKEFVQTEVEPHVTEILKSNAFPAELYRRCGELGFWSLNVPEELGGLDKGLMETTIVLEELAKVFPTLAFCVATGMDHIPLLTKSPALQEYLEPCMSGELPISCSAADPKGRANTSEWEPLAVKDGDNWVLNGIRYYDANNQGGLSIAIGKTDDGQMKAFFVKKGTVGMKATEGYHDAGVYLKYGMAGSDGGTTVFENCRIPVEMACDIDINNSEYYLKACHNIAAQALGCAEGLLEYTINYSKMRTHDFKPLSELQVVAQKLTYLQTLVEVSHSAVYDSATMYDEAVQTGDADLMQAWAVKAEAIKQFVSESASTITKECIKLNGGMGYHTPALHHYVGDAMAYCIANLSNHVLGDRMAVLMGLKQD